MTTILSPVKWTGSKRYLAPRLAKRFPAKYEKVIEPFIGGGNLLPYYKAPVQASDICSPLIDLWNCIKEDPSLLLKDYTHHYETYKEKGIPYYYMVREWFNKDGDPTDFYFLNRNSVNGLVRFNSKGEFNASAHLGGRNGIRPDNLKKLLDKWQTYIKNVTFECMDFSHALLRAGENDFVFLDPPYANSLGAMYQCNSSKNYFNHLSLFDYLEFLNKKDINWMMTFDSELENEELSKKLSGLYKVKIDLDSGDSPFNRYKGIKKKVIEAVYTNYTSALIHE